MAVPNPAAVIGELAGVSGAPARKGAVDAAAPPDDCRHCGLCCFSRSPMYVRVTGVDWERLAGLAETFAHFIGHRAFMRMRDGHCAALERRTGENGAWDYFCTIYERRPQLCRDLERGSPACDAERAAKSDRPPTL